MGAGSEEASKGEFELLGTLILNDGIKRGRILCRECGLRECAMDGERPDDYWDYRTRYLECLSIPA